jgi:GNAT superfamily N-acetyltransferase
MRDDDVEPLTELVFAADADLRRRRGEPVEEWPDPSVARRRFAHPLRTDPDGAWVAEDEHGLAGCSFAFLREGVWILSQLAVRPDRQSQGLGSELLRRTHEYGADAKGRLIAASPDPRALRAYARLGLDVHPCLLAHGTPQGVSEPPGIRVGDARDVPFAEEVDRRIRGAAHGPDIAALLESGQQLLVAEGGYAVAGDRGLRLLAADDEASAHALLRAALSRAGDETVRVNWITGRQQWAIEVCVAARLELRADTGALFTGGDVGRLHPYLPSGAYL